MGVQEARSDSSLKDRERQELRFVLSVRARARGLNLVVLLLSVESILSCRTALFGESTFPFIDEGDGLIREREYASY